MNAVEHRKVFLQALFEGLPGLIEVRSINGAGIPRPTFHTSIEGALKAIDQDVRDGMNVYVGVATRGEKRGENGKRSGGKDNLIAVRGWFVDKDELLTLAGIIPQDIVEMLKERETLEKLRAQRAKRESTANRKPITIPRISIPGC